MSHDSWDHRVARMHPQHSRMEEWLLLELHKRGLHPFTDVGFLVKVDGREMVTIPDFDFRDSPDCLLEVYVDGEKVHLKKQHRDKKIREALAKQYPDVRVLPITYRGNSKAEKARVLKLIVEAAKTMVK